MRDMEQSHPEPSSVHPRVDLEDTTCSHKYSCQPFLPEGAFRGQSYPSEQRTEDKESRAASVGACPAQQPGHQCKEASEGHAPAPL